MAALVSGIPFPHTSGSRDVNQPRWGCAVRGNWPSGAEASVDARCIPAAIKLIARRSERVDLSASCANGAPKRPSARRDGAVPSLVTCSLQKASTG